MPQLEFTLWFAKLITKWTIIAALVYFINSSASMEIVSKSKTATTSHNKELTKKWPW